MLGLSAVGSKYLFFTLLDLTLHYPGMNEEKSHLFLVNQVTKIKNGIFQSVIFFADFEPQLSTTSVTEIIKLNIPEHKTEDYEELSIFIKDIKID
jgi:hypothetical protein